MAKAKMSDKLVEVVVKKKQRMITLQITEDEASALAAIFDLVGGHPDTTERGLTDSISSALSEIGVKPSQHAFGSITFGN